MTQVINELTLDQMAELFQRNKSTISRHVKNIFVTGELNADSTVTKNATTAADGINYLVAFCLTKCQTPCEYEGR